MASGQTGGSTWLGSGSGELAERAEWDHDDRDMIKTYGGLFTWVVPQISE